MYSLKNNHKVAFASCVLFIDLLWNVNFLYFQEQNCSSFCKSHKSTYWRPSPVKLKNPKKEVVCSRNQGSAVLFAVYWLTAESKRKIGPCLWKWTPQNTKRPSACLVTQTGSNAWQICSAACSFLSARHRMKKWTFHLNPMTRRYPRKPLL